MPRWGSGPFLPVSSDEQVFDDGGSGLFDACMARFDGLGCTITCDSHHAVWVKSADGSFAVGLAPWLLDSRSLEKVLDNVEAKIHKAGVTIGV